MTHPNRAVAPNPGVGQNTKAGSGRAARLGAVRSHPGGYVCRSPGLSMRQYGCRLLAHFVALEHVRLSPDIAEGHRSRSIARAARPALSRVSTAAINGGRCPAGTPRASASRGRAVAYARLCIAAFPAPRRSRSVLKRGATSASRLRVRSLLISNSPGNRTARRSQGVPDNEGQHRAAEPNPACSGLAALAADARG